MASCGFIDVLLYLSTRKALVRSSLGVKRSRANRQLPVAVTSRFWNTSSKEDDAPSVRMDEFYLGGGNRGAHEDSEHAQKGAIVVSKTVIRREESEDAFDTEHSNAGDTTPGRSDSVRSLVGIRG